MPFQRPASEMEFDEKIAEARVAAQLEGQSETDNGQIDKEHGYGTDIRQLFQTEIVAFGVPTCTEIQSMIINKIIYYHASQLFPVVREPIDKAIEHALETGLLRNNEAAR